MQSIRHSFSFFTPLLMLGSLAILLGSCATAELYTTFRHGQGEVMHYVKPMAIRPVEGSTGSGEADFTLHLSTDSLQRVVVNFSLHHASPWKRVDSVEFLLPDGQRAVVGPLEQLFVEAEGKGFQSRYSCELPPRFAISLLQQPTWQFSIFAPSQVWRGTLKERKKMEKLQRTLIPLL